MLHDHRDSVDREREGRELVLGLLLLLHGPARVAYVDQTLADLLDADAGATASDRDPDSREGLQDPLGTVLHHGDVRRSARDIECPFEACEGLEVR